jgi:glycosyltransferase involved in cell wall biosynthesis
MIIIPSLNLSLMNKKVIVSVTNDLSNDRRMQRICDLLFEENYDLTFVGRTLPTSKVWQERKYHQKRLKCIVNKGPLFYAEFNLRLFFYLLFNKADILYSVDNDTILANSIAKSIKGNKLIFDSHEYFTEVPELMGRNLVKKVWHHVGKFGVSKAELCITVGPKLAEILSSVFSKKFFSIRNVPNSFDYSPHLSFPSKDENVQLFYLGALNEGRGLPEIIRVMELLPSRFILKIAGEGDLSESLRKLVVDLGLKDRVEFLGMLSPEKIQIELAKAHLGINLLDKLSLSYYYSLANKAFDYIHAGLPCLHMDFPEYRELESKYNIGYLAVSLEIDYLKKLIEIIFSDQEIWNNKSKNCTLAKNNLNWDKEKVELSKLVKNLVDNTPFS